MAIRKSSSSGIPFGITEGRPAAPAYGQLYSNGETQRLELYTVADSWENIVQEVPGVSSISGNYSQQTDSGTISIYGTNFVSGAIATAIGTDGVQVNADSTTYNSLVQLTATFTGLSNAYEPYDIKVTNPSNLFGLMPDALYVNASPVWVTSSGSLGTFNEQVSIALSALSATDSDSTVTYSLASGSSLPSGVTLNSSTGVISGTLPNITSDTTYTFTINASDGVNSIPRSFSITSNALIEIEYLIVGGGAGGGSSHGPGGGAGGVLTSVMNVSRGGAYSLAIGSGGSGGSGGSYGSDGTSTVAFSLTAGGGGGGGRGYSNTGSSANGRDGLATNGSGGGAGSAGATRGSGNGAGNNGGNGNSSSPGSGGGGGGAGAVGGNAYGSGSQGATGGAGGIGIQSSITGTATYYAGGGGGGGWTTTGAAGGLGGGGKAGDPSGTGTSGTSNTGGGGGGGGDGGGAGGNGGSGVVIIAYPDTTGAITTIPGTLTYDQPTRSGYRVYRFTAGSGTITF